jgi:radical SAM protein with 4Fe4S-binding SPASM domain
MMGGYVISCCNTLMSNNRTFLKEHSFGNLFEQSFKDIWYSDRYKRFRKTVNNPKCKVPIICTGCRAYDFSERAKKYGVDKEL